MPKAPIQKTKADGFEPGLVSAELRRLREEKSMSQDELSSLAASDQVESRAGSHLRLEPSPRDAAQNAQAPSSAKSSRMHRVQRPSPRSRRGGCAAAHSGSA